MLEGDSCCSAQCIGRFKRDKGQSWESFVAAYDQVLKCMASIPGLPDHLAPALHSAVAKKIWRVASISLLPKWKCPGLKWRLIVNKHFTPCCGLHSLVSRALFRYSTKFFSCSLVEWLLVHGWHCVFGAWFLHPGWPLPDGFWLRSCRGYDRLFSASSGWPVWGDVGCPFWVLVF